jgi:hypothetical protein
MIEILSLQELPEDHQSARETVLAACSCCSCCCCDPQ